MVASLRHSSGRWKVVDILSFFSGAPGQFRAERRLQNVWLARYTAAGKPASRPRSK